jgi:hypothetical protein
VLVFGWLAGAAPLSWLDPTLDPAPNESLSFPRVRAHWTEVLDEATVTAGRFLVRGAWSGELAGEIDVYGGEIEMELDYPGPFVGEPLEAFVATGVCNEQGGCLPAPLVWRFDHDAGIQAGEFPPPADQQFSMGVVLTLDAGDLDGDRDVDAFVGREGGIHRLVNDDGVLSAGFVAETAWRTVDAALGDLDGDGDLDAWTLRDDGEPAPDPGLVWWNDGSGAFSQGPAIGFASVARQSALGDFDGDGDLDAFVGTAAGDEVWINQGGAQGGAEGSFARRPPLLGAADTTAVGAGDVDGDLDLDLFAVNASNQPDRVYLNDGGGDFTDSGQALGASHGTALALADVDDDGDLDAFVGNSFATPADEVWLNDGEGGFVDSGLRLGNGDTFDVVAARVSGGWFDVITGEGDGTHWRNLGFGKYVEQPLDLGAGTKDALAIGEFTPGKLDLLVEGGTVRLFLNRYPEPEPGEEDQCAAECAANDWCFLGCLAVCHLTVGPRPVVGGTGGVDLPVFDGVRDRLLARTPAGRRYAQLYDQHDPEVLALLRQTPALWQDAFLTAVAWQPSFQALLSGQGATTTIGESQIARMEDFLDGLEAAGSPALRQMLQAERARLGPLQDYAGRTMQEALESVVGSPIFDDGFEWGDARDWSASQP